MSYKVVKEDACYILETDSGHKIHFDESLNYLNKITRKLNLGAGFNGFTPLFLCRPISTEIINNSKDL